MLGWWWAVVLAGVPELALDAPRAALVPVPGIGPLLHRVATVPAGALLTQVGDRPAPASGTGPLELPEVLASAAQAYPAIIAARADVVAAQAEQLAAEGGFDWALKSRAFLTPDQLGPYPQVRVDATVEVPIPLTGVNAFAGYRIGQPLSGGLIQSYYRERETFPAGELRAGFSAPMLRNFLVDRRRATVTRAELGQQAAERAEQQQRIEVNRLAATRYWDWVAAGMRQQVAADLLRIAVERDRQLAVRVKSGDVPFFDQLDNQRAVAQRQAFSVQTRRGVEQTSFELALFLRDQRGDPVLPDDRRLPPSMPEPDATFGDAATLNDALARRPDVQRLLLQQSQQRVEISLQKNQLLPGLDLGLVFSQDLGNNPGTADPKLNKPEFEFAAVLDVPLLYRLPLGRIRAAEASLARIEAQLRFARDRVQVEVRDALSALAASRERLGFTREEVAVARKLEAGERQRFDLGDSNLLFVNLRETQTAEARLREIDALLEYHRAVAAFRAAVAFPLDR